MTTVVIRSLGDAPLVLETQEQPRTLSAARHLLRQYRQQKSRFSLFGDRTDLSALIAALEEQSK